MSDRRFINGKPVVRCSNLDQLLNCPGSRTLTELLPKWLRRGDGAESWEGQWCHWEGAKRFIEAGAEPPEGGLPGPRIPMNFEPSEFARWMTDYYVDSTLEEVPADWAMEVEAEMLYEFDSFWLSGHVDFAAIAPDASEVIFRDLKTGARVVDAAECNWQIAGYAVLYRRAYGPVLRRVNGGICQPRLREEEGEKVSTVDLEGEWLDNLEILLEVKIGEALASPMLLDSKLEEGSKHCRWCDAALTCPAKQGDIDAMKIEMTTEMLEAASAGPDLAQLLRMAVAKKALSPVLEKAWDKLKELLEDEEGRRFGDEPPYAFLKDTKGQRQIEPARIETVWEILAEELGAEAYAALSFKIEEIEKGYCRVAKAAGEKLPHKTKKADRDSGEKRAERAIGDFVTRTPTTQLQIVT